MITAATFQESKQTGPTTYRVRARLTDSVKGTFDQWFTVSGSTLVELRDDISKQIVALNAIEGTGDILAGIAPGTNIPVTWTPPAPAAPSALDVWIGKARRALKAQELTNAGVTDPDFVSDKAALVADVNATYVAGYLGGF